uniref:Uncharacterized protein n=1 Tax=Panagrolaimus sp. ES5 TaxID=591445 RepID=A0AC34FXM8_9BILA
MNIKITYSVILVIALNAIVCETQIANAYDYGYSGAWGYSGYRGWGNPYNYYYSSHPVAATTSQGSANPIASALGGISSNIFCANCGFGRN